VSVPAPAGTIGPDVILRTVEALRERRGERETDAVLEAAGLSPYGREPPQTMVPEAEVTALFRELYELLGETQARIVAQDAGRRTAESLLAQRIPGLAQTVLRLLPPRLAARALLAALGKNTSTFAGSAAVELQGSRPARIIIAHCPLCRELRRSRPACDFYAGTFERFFETLVGSDASVSEITCQALGGNACTFSVRY
jgi:divinyl protochlorophyllide a 8-vinyl-reductase